MSGGPRLAPGGAPVFPQQMAASDHRTVLITAPQSRGGRVTRDSDQARDNHCDAETQTAGVSLGYPEQLQLESH